MAEPESVFLRRTIADLERRLRDLESLEQAPGSLPSTAAMPAVPPPPPRPRVQPSPVFSAAANPPPPSSAPGSPLPPAPLPPAPRQAPAYARPSAETLLKWSGLLLVFLAAVFLVSTAIDRGWIGPELQLAGSFAIGGALVAAGVALKDKRPDWGPPLAGVGTTVLSVCAVAGWQWLDLAAVEVWLAVAVAIHALALGLSHRFQGPGVAAASTVASVIAVLSIAEAEPASALLTTVIVMSTMAMTLVLRRPSLHLWAAATVFPAFFILAVVGRVEDDNAGAIVTLVAGVLAGLAIWFMPIAIDQIDVVASRGRAAWMSITRRLPLSIPLSIALAIGLTSGAGRTDTGIIYFVCGTIGIALAGGLFASVRSGAVRCDPSVWIAQVLGGVTATVVASAVLFEGPGLLASLIVQSGALLVFIRFVDDRFALGQAALVTGIAAIFGAGRMLYGIDVELDIVDHAVHLALVAVLAGWAVVEPEQQLRRPLAVVAYLAGMLWAIPTFVHLEQGQAGISSVWALIGLAALIGGSVRGSKMAINGGLATLAIVVFKLLTVDLVDVDTFWRVGLFFLLGGAFLGVSYRFGAGLGDVDGSGDDAPVDPMGPPPPSTLVTSPPSPPQRPTPTG